jgi:hypothetical protein
MARALIGIRDAGRVDYQPVEQITFRAVGAAVTGFCDIARPVPRSL